MAQDELILSLEQTRFRFTWDVARDEAVVSRGEGAAAVWKGSLLPLFEVNRDGARHGIAATVDRSRTELSRRGGKIGLSFAGLGDGELIISADDGFVRFEKLSLRWSDGPKPLVAMYFGAKLLTPEQSDVVADLSRDFWPDWQCEGFCIPAAKGGPEQSFFRRWDFGNATIPLGSFGPALGTPYAAAYPRPLFAAALGGENGWVAVGCGDVPDGAMLFQIRASSATIEYRYREDLWGPPAGAERVWNEPLRLTFAEVAWDAYDKLFTTFPTDGPVDAKHQPPLWNTWGDFKLRRFDMQPIIQAASERLGTKLLCMDEHWETFDSSGIPSLERFPRFHEDLAQARAAGLEIGFWQSSGWMADLASAGLSHDDVLVGIDGRPRRANWSLNPHESGLRAYCLDPSSPRTIAFLRERTTRIVRELGASMFKLDFAYGLPGPDTAAPRDPALRGERMGFTLLKTIADAARAARPDITIQYYSIHPLFRTIQNLCALDDLGDAGGHLDASYEIEGHAQWSIWAALAGARGTAINASGGYNKDADAEIMLNTAIIGAPGSILPVSDYDASPEGMARCCRRNALARWRRRTTQWRPLWLDSEPGRLGLEPALRSWGRMELIDGAWRTTALALREQLSQMKLPDSSGAAVAPLAPIVPFIEHWTGRWALIAQDDRAIDASAKLAVIPFDASTISLRSERKVARVTAVYMDGERSAGNVDVHDTTVRITVAPGDLAGLIGYLIE